MGENHSIKEYYIKLEKMMSNAVNMLDSLNKALTTTSQEITIDLINSSNDTHTSLRIPSFLYLEGQIEQLNNIISNLFDIPKSGEAWLNNSSNMHKITLVKSNTAPIIPTIGNTNNLGFNIKDNNIFKDLVSPKTYIRLNIDNLPDNIEKILMKKIVVHNSGDIEYLRSFTSYSDIKNALFNRRVGTDYEEYDTILDLPIKADKFKSNFKIEKCEQIDISANNRYKLQLDTIAYYDKDDQSIQYILKKGDYICLPNEYVIYKVLDVTTIYNAQSQTENEYVVTVEESIGHISLQTYEENSNMYFQIYNKSYSEYNYIDIPLEENPYIIIFLSTIYNNIRSEYSSAIHIDLNNIYMMDNDGKYILDETNNKIGYLSYYKNYCKNVGDLLNSFAKFTYPQPDNFSESDLLRLTDSEEMKQLVSNSLYSADELLLSVRCINEHLIDDASSERIINLHSQKNELNSQLRSLNDNIDQVYSQLLSVNFAQETSLTQESLKSKLDNYYSERTELEKQLLNIVDDININKESILGTSKSKYRVRGVTDANDKYDSSIESPIISYIHNEFGFNCDLIELQVEYKYKNATKDSTSIVNSIDNSLFTDWNRLDSIERERYLKFDPETGKYKISFYNYSNISNVIKWNQIDIPINQGEDVVIRIRYKYNIGQPFINLYTPWSNEITIPFPVEYSETNNITSIIQDNDNDVINAKFLRTLINDGYEEHITNKIIDNSKIYYHMPENIYSGFNTPENNLISLKDKLIDMSNQINIYKETLDNEINSQYRIFLEWDNSSIELSNLTTNNITINELINGASDVFVKKNINLVIKNTGSTPIKLFSIFPGNVDTPLLNANNRYFNDIIENYQRVPMLIEGSSIPSESIIPQYLGQWIYFRQNNPYTLKSLYYDSKVQNTQDNSDISSGNNATFIGKLSEYIGVNNKQVLLPYRSRTNIIETDVHWGFLYNNGNSDTLDLEYIVNDPISNNIELLDNIYQYSNCDNSNNEYILKYEHLINYSRMTDNANPEIAYLNNSISFSDFIKDLKKSDVSYYNGAFLIPELIDKNQIICDLNESNQFYKQLDVGKTLSVPLLFEYFLSLDNASNNVQISKTLAFDIKTSLMKDPEHYIITITAKYDYSQSVASTRTYSNLVDGLINTSDN